MDNPEEISYEPETKVNILSWEIYKQSSGRFMGEWRNGMDIRIQQYGVVQEELYNVICDSALKVAIPVREFVTDYNTLLFYRKRNNAGVDDANRESEMDH